MHQDMLDIWVVEARLGGGGMGTVYRCHNRDATRIKSAIKVLDPRLASSSEVRRRFVREAELLFELDHPNIVKVRNIRMDANPPFIEMAFVEGDSLVDHITRGPLPLGAAAHVTSQVAAALAHCHARGVRHRDVKPANILVQAGHATLVDFGIAAEASGTITQGGGGTMGSLSYTPPEWGSGNVDSRAWDAFSLGIVMYEALTGRMAFPPSPGAGLREEIIRQIDLKRSIDHLDPGDDIPDELREICRSLTATNPDNREVELGSVADKLAAFCRDRDDLQLADIPKPVEAPSSETLALGLGLAHGEDTPPALLGNGPRVARNTPMANQTMAFDDLPRKQTLVPEEPAEAPAKPVNLREKLESEDAEPAPAEPEKRKTRPWVLLAAMFMGVLTGLLWMSNHLDKTEDEGVRSSTGVTPQRPLRLSTDGETNDLPLTVLFDGQPTQLDTPTVIDVGTHTVRALLGPACDEGEGPNCLVHERSFQVIDGVGPQEVRVTLPELPPIPIRLEPAPPEGARVWVADGPWQPVADARLPYGGQHTVSLQLGECPKDKGPCGDDCPRSCREAQTTITAPLQVDAAVQVSVELPSKRRSTSGGSSNGGLVTVKAFSSWLKSHPDYQPEAAIASGKAPKKYLHGWSGASPPAGLSGSAPVTRVTPSIAKAYCSRRGGLADFDAEPTTWKPAQARDHEIRSGAAGVTSRRYDGQQVAVGSYPSPTHAVRCAR